MGKWAQKPRSPEDRNSSYHSCENFVSGWGVGGTDVPRASVALIMVDVDIGTDVPTSIGIEN